MTGPSYLDNILFRRANSNDLTAIVSMLADDELGAGREDYQIPLPDSYVRAFDNIDKDKNQELTVALLSGEVIGTFHLTFVQYLTYQGGVRAQIEAVRVRSDQRGKGLGKYMFEYAIERSIVRGAHLLQLTTDKKRPEALKFYQALGFRATHEGMKLHLDQTAITSE